MSYLPLLCSVVLLVATSGAQQAGLSVAGDQAPPPAVVPPQQSSVSGGQSAAGDQPPPSAAVPPQESSVSGGLSAAGDQAPPPAVVPPQQSSVSGSQSAAVDQALPPKAVAQQSSVSGSQSAAGGEAPPPQAVVQQSIVSGGQSVAGDAAETMPAQVVEIVTPKIAFKLAEGVPLVDAQVKMLGSKCKTHQDCLPLNNTSCTDGTCLCSTGYIPSKLKTGVCLKVPSGLGDKCEEKHQCEHVVNRSECHDFKCSCPLNYAFLQDSCWEKQMLGGKCNVTQQCEDVPFAVCLQGVCTCQTPYIPSPINKCLAPAGTVYKATCVEDIQCSHSFGDQAHCASGECVCRVNHHFNGTKCTLDKKLGEACLLDSDCEVSSGSSEEASRTCVGNACTCPNGFTSLLGEDICTKSSGEELAVSLTWVLCIVLAKYYLA